MTQGKIADTSESDPRTHMWTPHMRIGRKAKKLHMGTPHTHNEVVPIWGLTYTGFVLGRETVKGVALGFAKGRKSVIHTHRPPNFLNAAPSNFNQKFLAQRCDSLLPGNFNL